MIDTLQIYQDLAEPLGDAAAHKLASVLGSIYRELQQAVTKEDFRELKEAVSGLAEAQARLAEAQARTEARVDTLAVRMEELVEAQARTEARIGELVEAQSRTEARVERLAEAQERTEQTVEKLARGLDTLRQEVGGLSRTMGYALENDAYRALPDFLLREHGLRVTERFVRTEIEGEEVNFLARAQRTDGTPVLIVGESKSRLDERRRAWQQAEWVLEGLQEKVAAAARAYPDVEIVPLLVTHYARPAFLEAAQAQGVIVAQSFQW